MSEFHSKTIEQTLQELNANPIHGLSAGEACERLKQNGPNRLKSAGKKPLPLRILSQFKDFLVIILLAAAIISVIAGDGLKDAILIIGILLVNVFISITQENRADNALAQLKSMSSPKAKVKRDGQIIKIDSETVVAGDIVILDAGDYIPADVRVIESINLKIDESALTGESAPVTKNASVILDKSISLGDRINLAAMGTIVTYGRGAGVVCATGMETEMGKIAAFLNQTQEAITPLQHKLNAMAKALGLVCIAACALIFGIGFLYGMDIIEMLMISVSLAVAAVPEGVAIVATVILALGVQKMVKANVIVKRLRAVETLGSTTVICSDKTGTLTQNKMTVVKIFDTDTVYEVTDPGRTFAAAVKGDKPVSSNIPLMAEIATLCNDAIYTKNEEKIIGDPTEGAMLVFAAKLGIIQEALSAKHKRLQEIPFDSDRKLMSTFNDKNGIIIMNTKGAPDAVIKRSSKIYINGKTSPMTDEIRQQLTLQNEQFAAMALRVLAFAYKECVPAETGLIPDKNENIFTEKDLTYVGMMCMIDPPREEAAAAIAQCHAAGINVKMITGDHKTTAAAIAESLGIISPPSSTKMLYSAKHTAAAQRQVGDSTPIQLTGLEIDNLTDAELAEKVKITNIFARVSPEHKVRIITAIKENGDIAAMTGDGVNDAPSLKKADIGIAMGITGTDVSKEAADMILTDDNFVSIVSAVEHGRTIYGNIRKVTGYLLSCNIGEILIIFMAILFGLPVPLVATQLLFVNLLTDAFPAFALGMEGKEPDVMKRQPRDPKEPIINKSMRHVVAFRAAILCAVSLGAFFYGYFFHDYITAISMCFFTLVAGELLAAYLFKTEAAASRGLFTNRFLNIATGLSLGILVAVIYIPFLSGLFTTVPLSLSQLVVCLALVAAILAAGQAYMHKK